MSEPRGYQRFLAELKRRRVFRVMAVYGAVAFVILQVADIALPGLGLPEWTITLILALTVLGFPIAIVLAWAFDMTPEGMQRTEKAAPGEITQIVGAPAAKRWPVGLAAAGGTALFLVGAWLALGRPGPGESGGLVDPEAPVESIAVLPFADLSPEGDQQYFGDGLAEELLDALAKVDGLVVAARTSSFRFKGEEVDIPEVAKQLRVQTVLEGSVRRGGDRVRITAQLVNADGFHLWSDSYDRSVDQMADLIGVQEEIAQSIVAALSLAPEAGSQLETLVALGTDNLEAYNTVLRGRYLMAQRTPRGLAAAAEEFERAIELDPDYARAWADLAMAHNLTTGWGFSTDSLVEQRGAEATARALELDPTMAQAYTAQGYIYAWIHYDSAAAADNFARAIELDPRYPTAYHWQGEILGDTGHPESGIPYLETARELDPLSPIILTDLAEALDQAGRWEEADALLEEVLELEPDFAPALQALAFHAQLDNDADAALAYEKRFYEKTPDSDPVVRAQRLLFAQYLAHDQAAVVETFRTVAPTDTSQVPAELRLMEGVFLYSLRETAGPEAVEAYASAQASRWSAADSVGRFHLEGFAAALTGREPEARAALARIPADWDGGFAAAEIRLALGETQEFVDAMESAYQSMTMLWDVRARFQLEHDPMLDVLRDDPRFQTFLERLPPYPGPNAQRE
jgi:TolB-like protein/Flp pilus assembly protein TadD